MVGAKEPEEVRYGATPSEIPGLRGWFWYYAWGITRYRCPGCNLYFSIGDKAYTKLDKVYTKWDGHNYYCEPCLLKIIW